MDAMIKYRIRHADPRESLYISTIDKSLFGTGWKQQKIKQMTESQGYRVNIAVLIPGQVSDGTFHRLLGYVITCFNKVGEEEIIRIGVHPDYQREGIGSSLVDSVFHDSPARRVSVSAMLSPDREEDEEGIDFFRRLGFKACHVFRSTVDGIPSSENVFYQFRLTLKKSRR